MRRYILGFFTAAAAAAALWLLHRTFPCPLTALLAPANGSPWEMGKLLFWPYLPAALVIWRLGPEGGCRGGHCLLLAAMPLCMAGLCWLLPGRWLRLWSLVLAGGLTLHGTVLSRRVPGGELVWYVLAILVGIAYLLLTVGAPDIGPLPTRRLRPWGPSPSEKLCDFFDQLLHIPQKCGAKPAIIRLYQTRRRCIWRFCM